MDKNVLKSFINRTFPGVAAVDMALEKELGFEIVGFKEEGKYDIIFRTACGKSISVAFEPTVYETKIISIVVD